MKQFTCPKCGSHYFGTSNCTGPMTTWIRHCHGYKQNGQPCRFCFPITDDNKYFADEQNRRKEIDMELRKQYAEIAEAHLVGCADHVRERGYAIALACQELADRPPRELTDADIHKVVALHGYVAADGGMLHKMLKAFEAAVHAKQREPQVVKFRAARNGHSNAIELFRLADDGAPLNEYFKPAGWEWLEPAQEFEVRI